MLDKNRSERRGFVLAGRDERRLFPRSARRHATAFARLSFFFGSMVLHDLHTVPPGEDRRKWKNQRKGERRKLRAAETPKVEVRRASRRAKRLTKRERKLKAAGPR